MVHAVFRPLCVVHAVLELCVAQAVFIAVIHLCEVELGGQPAGMKVDIFFCCFFNL